MKRYGNLVAVVLAVLQFTAVPVWGAAPAQPTIESQSAVLMDENTGEILYEKNGSEQCYPASITKLLTALVTVEKCDLTETVIFSYDAVYDVEDGSGNAIQLEAGDKLTVEDCLYAMILESSNQAANALAEHVAGSLEAFAIYMDTKQEELGCTNSNFVNPSGLNDAQQLTTAEDMALIAQAAFENPILAEICSATEYNLPATLNNPNGYELHVEHQLLDEESQEYEYAYALAGKTGYTSTAGNTLVTSAEKDGQALIAVVMKSDQTHYEDTIKLLDYGFQYLEQNPKETVTAVNSQKTISEASQETPMVSESTKKEEQPEKSVSRWPMVALGGGAALVGIYGISIYVKISRARKRRLQMRRRRAAQYHGQKGREAETRRQKRTLRME